MGYDSNIDWKGNWKKISLIEKYRNNKVVFCGVLMKGPLSNIRVIDLSKLPAGPFGSMLLEDLGAEIIKMEVLGSDPIRMTPGPRTGPDESYSYLAYNRNKKSVELDLLTESDREAFYDLVRISDMVLDSFKPGVM